MTKNLTSQQLRELAFEARSRHMNMAWDDPNIQKERHEERRLLRLAEKAEAKELQNG